MKANLYGATMAVLLCLSGCKKHALEPDYSKLQDLTYTVQQAATVSAASSEAQVAVYPNPFVYVVNVSLYSPKSTTATVYFTDEKGRYSKKIELKSQASTTVTVNFDGMPKGVYLCEVQQAGQVDRYRLIKTD